MSEGAATLSAEEQISQITRRARSSALWLGSTNVLWQVISWALTLLTARILNPQDYGLLALIETITPYLALAAALNIPLWLVQTEDLSEREERVALTLCLGLGAAMSLLSFSMAPAIAAFYETPSLVLPFQVVSVSFVLQGLYTVPDALLQRELQFKPLALRRFCVGIGRSVLQLVLAIWGWGFWSLVIGIVVKEFIYALWVISYRGLPKGLAWDTAVVRKIMRFGLPATASAIAWIVFNTSDKVIVGKLLGVEILGYYSLAFLLIDLPLSKINSVLRPILIPYFSRIQSHHNELREIFLRVVRGIAALSFPILLGLAVVAPEAVVVLLGEKWLPMVGPLGVLCVVGLLRAFADNVPPLLLALGHPGKEFVFNFASLVIMPPAFYLFGTYAGLDGVLAAWLLVYPVVIFLILRALRQAIDLDARAYSANLRAPVLCAALMTITTLAAGILIGPERSPLVLLLVKIAVGAITYLAAFYLLFRKELLEIVPRFRQADIN